MQELDDPVILRTLLEDLPTAVYLVDRERKILFWNSGAEKITGYLRQEVLGRHCRQSLVVHYNELGHALDDDECMLTETMADGKHREARVFVRHREGYRIPVRVSTIPIRNQRGTIIGAAETFNLQTVAPSPDRRSNTLEDYGCLDDLTGIPNHAFTESQLCERLRTFSEHGIPFSVLCLAVERMSFFRRSYGQEASETILRVLAQTLKNTLRPMDILGRWMGDQFLVILDNCSAEVAGKVAERVQGIVSSASIEWWGDELKVNIMIGWTTVVADDTAESIADRACRAQLASKANSANGAA